MATAIDSFREIPLLSGMSDEQISSIVEAATFVELRPGERLYSEGEPAEYFYILLEGELEISRNVDGQEVTLNTYRKGAFTGEMALLLKKANLTTVTGIKPSRLLRLSAADFQEKLVDSSPVARFMLPSMAKRIESADILVHQRAKLAALDKMSQGLAHELNNPAAASVRAASHMRDSLQTVNDMMWRFFKEPRSPQQLSALRDIQAEVLERRTSLVPLDPLTVADREDEIAAWLDEKGVPYSYELAPTLVRQGLTVERLQRLYVELGAGLLPDAVTWLNSTVMVTGLLEEIEQGTKRISELVGAVKRYSFMDRPPIEEVDIHEGLESTLIIMRQKLEGRVEIIRDYDRSLPRIMAYGSELNEVWTNIIDNAVNAMNGTGKLWLRTRSEDNEISVEIADNGHGIPAHVEPHIFEPFYTTKGIGQGNGLGLNISYNIVVNHHHGDIKVETRPDATCFIVRLPMEQPPESTAPARRE